jgi:hypothetical protein
LSRNKHKQRKDRERREKAHREMTEQRLARRRSESSGTPRRGAPARAAQPGPADAPGERGPSRFLQERAQRWMLWAGKERGLPSGEDVRELVASGELAEYKNDPREAAQELAFEALEAPDRQAAQHLAMQSLHFDPTCADARRVLADIDASSHVDRVGRLKKALMDEEEKLGDVMGEFETRLSDAVEARPYLRTRFDLAIALWAAGRQSRGNGHLETLFAQDQPDLLGIRYPLLMARLYRGDVDGAGILLDDEETEQAELLVRWARVMQRVLAGDTEGAEALYVELREGREGEADSLATEHPEDFAYGGFFRDEIYEYAGICLRMLHWAWHAHPETSVWLKERAAAEA